MNHAKDELGNRHGRLVAIGRVPTTGSNAAWLCQCDCGGLAIVAGTDLRRGTTVSCGCYRADRVTTHGLSEHPLNAVWRSMRGRCNNPADHAYDRYGARGIRVCDRWDAFENFLADMGERPDGMSLDRIDNDGGYEPSNCRWATATEQRMNQRRMKAAA